MSLNQQLDSDFKFVPLPPIEHPSDFALAASAPLLGPLAELPGKWVGKGFNVIWRPNNIVANPGQDRFLELNVTADSIVFNDIGGAIPNRGLLQPDMEMFGVTYLNQISDANVHAGLHIEPGIWALVPKTSDPLEGQTVIRMASIPHGTAILAQGTTLTAAGPPSIPNVNILPFPIGNPGSPIVPHFPEQTLTNATAFRSPAPQLVGVTQAMVNNPNSVLQAALVGHTVLSTTMLHVSTNPTSPVVGGGTANTAFLKGAAHGPNADAAVVSATFWIETVKGTPNFHQLQYSQTVLLNFNGLSWPHITVGTLKKV